MKNILCAVLFAIVGTGITESLSAANNQAVTINTQEKSAILFMREEEKLARDVYVTLGKKWDIEQMQRIAKSEQRHMNALKNLIQRFGLEDSVTNDAVGKFKTAAFTALYKKLIISGSKSRLDALKVGATIEDLDINDLDKRIAQSNNATVIKVFKNLNRGSRNHLRSFNGALTALNATYKPQYISQDKFNTIIAGSVERGGNGKGYGRGRRNRYQKQ